MNNKVKIVLVDNTNKKAFPRKAKDDKGNACYDVIATAVEHTPKYIAYKLGFKTEFSEEWRFDIKPCSRNSKKDILMCNSPGTIDSNFRGEWEVRYKVVNNHGSPDIYQVGDVVAQISFERVYEPEWEECETLSESGRGEGGFGSTNENVK